MPTEPDKSDDDFQKELVELFGQEAHEWLLQIHSALAELESQPDLDRHTQLVDAVVRGITSLGGSAATVNLPEVERATFALLPFIEILKDRTTATRHDFATVREQFGIVIAAVTTATGITLNIVPPQASPSQAEPMIDLLTLLNALRNLHVDSAIEELLPRSLIPHVMQRLEQEARQGAKGISAKGFQQMLHELQLADAQCLDAFRQQLPAVGHSLARLRMEGLAALDSDNVLGGCLQHIEYLQGIAKQAQVGPLVPFLTGLQSFLSLVLRHRLVLTSQRVQAVETRIRAVLMTVEDWITAGEQERDAMSRLLQAS